MLCFIHRLLVGAPRAVALPLQRANRTGGLYSCDITSQGPCIRVEFDNDGMLTFFLVPIANQSCCPLSAFSFGKDSREHSFLEYSYSLLTVIVLLASANTRSKSL